MASGVSRPRLAVLLPMGHRDAELRHNFLQGFRLGQASVEALFSYTHLTLPTMIGV